MSGAPTRKVRVLVVDDSALVRKAISDALTRDPEIEVVGTALDPIIARDKIEKLQPDVVTLDIEMPRMDGLTFLKLLMKERPLPVIILSSLTTSASQVALDALQAGAVEVLAKPGSSYSIGDIAETLPQRVKAAAGARLRVAAGARSSVAVAPAKVVSAPDSKNSAMSSQPPVAVVEARPQPPVRRVSSAAKDERELTPVLRALAAQRRNQPDGQSLLTTNGGWHNKQIVLLGASTGGTEALKEVLTHLPRNMPPIAIVQHIPPHFSKAFADRLHMLCAFDVHEAVDGEPLHEGLAVVAPGGWHLLLAWAGDHYVVRLKQGPPVWHQRPAVDVLFNSAAEIPGIAPVVGLMTGMGRDGAEGMLKLRQRGAKTFAQNEETCVVFGMPRVAMELGAAEQMVPLQDCARVLLHQCEALRRG